MYYYSRSRQAPNRNNTAAFNRELFFLSYVVGNTLSLKSKKTCSLTTLTKICTNYIEDWYEIIPSDYKPCTDIKANPYGMVSTIIAPHFEMTELYVYEISKYAEKAELWKKDERGRKKDINFLMNGEEIKEILSKADVKPEFSFPKFSGSVIGQAEALSMIYHNFNPPELNILCSHKDVVNSKMCLDYAFRCWSTNFNDAINSIRAGDVETSMRHVGRAVRSCQQIEVKSGFILNGVPELIIRINEEIAPEITDRQTRYVFDDLRQRLHERAPHLDDFYITNLRKQYRLNREKIWPMTLALINYFSDNVGRSYDLSMAEVRVEMNENIKAMKTAFDCDSIIGDVEKNEVETNIGIIKSKYDNLYQKENLLKRFRKTGKRKERVDWYNCLDGSGETW